MYLQHIHAFCEQFSYSQETRNAINDAYAAFTSDAQAYAQFLELIERYKQDIECDFVTMLSDGRALSESIGVHPYTGQLLLLICLSLHLKEYYVQKNLPLDIWTACMWDIYYKIVECHMLHGVWGVFVDFWFRGFFRCQRFAFEKLQFELVEMPFDYDNESENIHVKKGVPVLKVHIPRTGTPLHRAGQLCAYKKASEFFGAYFQLNPVIFICDSWFLFPEMKNFVSPNSNLGLFISDYTLMDFGYFEEFYKITWRIYEPLERDLDKLPQNTSLQRKYLQHVKNGGKSGWGYGIFVYPSKK